MSAATPSAADRTLTLLTLVPYLMERGEATVAELASHFSLSEAQVRSTIMLLATSGVPGASRSYGPEDLFDIDWDVYETESRVVLTHTVALEGGLRLTAKEASALIAGLQYLAGMPGQNDATAIGALLDKLAHGTTGDAYQPLAVATTAAARLEPELAAIQEAIQTGHQLEFAYQNLRGERELRRVDPLLLAAQEGTWYLTAWCHNREARRTFQVERMAGVVVSAAAAHTHEAEEEAFDPGFFQDSDLPTVTIEVAEGAIPLYGELLPPASPGAPAGWARFELRSSGHWHGLKRMVAASGGLIRIVEPSEARHAVIDWAGAALQRYRSHAN